MTAWCVNEMEETGLNANMNLLEASRMRNQQEQQQQCPTTMSNKRTTTIVTSTNASATDVCIDDLSEQTLQTTRLARAEVPLHDKLRALAQENVPYITSTLERNLNFSSDLIRMEIKRIKDLQLMEGYLDANAESKTMSDLKKALLLKAMYNLESKFQTASLEDN